MIPKKVTSQYYPSLRSRKMVSRTVTKDIERIEIFKIYAPKYSSIGDDKEKVVPSLSGNNYAELFTKIESYCQPFIDMIESKRKQICPHCYGVGIIYEHEGSTKIKNKAS